MKRRTVHKITPSGASTFDQQFWPVLVALTVLSGIALGAVLTILRGPWMWGSLLVLPLLAALAIFLLFNLDDNRLRRSLQFAIITSLAAHLLVLVFASVINIFQNPFQPNERQVAQQPNRTIEISDQRAAFVWEQTNSRETPEPVVETERQNKPTTNLQPQPVPVVESKPEISPQLVRREKTSQSVPRQNRELSQLRRQTRNLQPQSSQQMTGEKVAETKTAPAAAKAEQKAESSKQADSVVRQSTPQKETSVEPEKASPAPDTNAKPVVAKSSSSPRKTRQSDTTEQAAPRPTPSTARNSRSTPRLPIASKQAPTSEKVAAATTTLPTKNEPSKSAGEVTRRPVESRTNRPAFTNRPKTELSPRPQLAKSVQRKTSTQSLPTISNPTSVTISPRRSTTESSVVSSPVKTEQPSRAPESKTASRELRSKTLSVSRSTAGVAGVGRANNLDRFVGGINSPASRASDSARRERTQSTASDTRMLTSSRKSQARRSVGATRVPTSAFKAETTAAAKISGAKTPGARTLESSATLVDAASTNHRDEVSAEKGSASVDLGPTKIVSDRQSRRRSGGGQPEVSRLNPESTRRSKDRSSQQPSLVASNSADVAAPRNQSATPPSANALEAASQSTFAARAGGSSATTVERWSAQNIGEIIDQGQSNLAQQLADSRQRARRNENDSSFDDDEEDDEDEENKAQIAATTRIAQAPVTKSDPGFGTARNDATATAQSNRNGDGLLESGAAKVSRQAIASVPGSTIGRTATSLLVRAANSLPIIEDRTYRSNSMGNAKRTEPDLTLGMAGMSKPRGSRSSRSNVAPTISGTALTPSPVVSNRGTSDLAMLDSLPVNISRSDLSAMEQIQGSELDIDAIEGPAGLGNRPDTYVGVMTRPASRESEQLQPDLKNRFRSNRFGGVPAINPDAVIAQEAFRNRSPSAMAKASEPTTEAAIHLGLEFLARYQSADGSWSLTGFDRDEPQKMTQLDSDTAATGLAVLAFQGAGYNHREFKYARQINHAIQWLIENQDEDGGLYVASDKKSDSACRLYSHGIAALALTEAYGMTQDVRLKEPAQKALDYIAKSQDPKKGGWRYFDEPAKKSSDTSVSGWMMMALQSGRLAGLNVNEDAFSSVDDWLEVAADPDNDSLYRYNPYAKDSKGVSRIQGRKPSPSMTSVGLLMRIYSGWEKDDPRLLAGADYMLARQLPSDATPQIRDTYYWYYATQVLKHIDGSRWEKWNDRLRPLLTRSQEKSGDFAGSWHPYKPVPDRWGAFGGRIYVTTMNLLSLEVRHRMLPLYRQGDRNKTAAPILVGTSEPMTEKISTNVRPPGKSLPEPISVEVAKASEPASDIELARNAEAKRTGIKRPEMNIGNPTIVKKPSVTSPKLDPGMLPSDDARLIESVKPTMTKQPLSPGRNPSTEIARNPKPTNKRTKRSVRPTAPGAVAANPTSNVAAGSNSTRPATTESKADEILRKPEIAESTPAIPNIDLKPATMPGEGPDVFSKSPSAMTRPKSRAGAPEIASKTPNPTKRPRKSTPVEIKPTAKATPKFNPPVEAKPKIEFVGVSGLVTLDGKVLKNANVELIPIDKDGTSVSARTNNLGRFNIVSAGTKQPGVKFGRYKVSITTYFESPDENIIDYLEMVPAKYNSRTSLRATISADKKNALKIELSTK